MLAIEKSKLSFNPQVRDFFKIINLISRMKVIKSIRIISRLNLTNYFKRKKLYLGNYYIYFVVTKKDTFGI